MHAHTLIHTTHIQSKCISSGNDQPVPVLNYSEVDMVFFRPTKITCCSNEGDILCRDSSTPNFTLTSARVEYGIQKL